MKIGLIGCGGMGSELARRAHKIETVRVCACFDADRAKALKLGRELDARVCSNIKQLLELVDAVIIGSPPYLHKQHCILSARAGKHIFCEKPFTVSTKDAEDVIAEAQRAGVKLMVGQVLRYIQPFAWIIESARSGEFGEVLSIFVARLGGKGGVWEVPRRKKLELRGGLLEEINAHVLDFMRCVGGEVKSVSAHLGNFASPDLDFEDNAFVLLRFKKGAIGCLHSSLLCRIGSYNGRVEFTDGDIVFDRSNDTIVYRRGWEELRTHTLSELQKDDPYLQELSDFVQSVRTGGEPPVTGYDGLKAIQLAESARVSSERGTEVPVPD